MFVVIHEKPGCFSQLLGVFVNRMQVGNEIIRTMEALKKDGEHTNQSDFKIIEAELNKNNMIFE
ncbi:hypothetical protein [Gluconobacter albidus]|uniref:Uncharacterized protein n=1 Tax=Gluconobacter albidus TaxID=318683 RepID=A0AAW3R0S6_9PROT|nr:hypothetical protein [Gluconobacter albidus]KXV42471.1 hypothetical protein AD941_00740 [Gluconobacter albidus]GBQ91155.1 hypothetical protein AA3250_2216 [Gluconobacter albidus NBRC 3250]GLQ68076.1 hypothetical protein GCM10007866_05240 [Gluconobacter albidus]